MDTFYKPPMQRRTECKALEDNYMNCLFQKTLGDKVFVNRCVLDSVLWFHLECPRNAAKFDDPVEFKRKFRDFFAHNKSIADAIKGQSLTQQRVKSKFGFQTGYAEDVQSNTKVRKFMDEFDQYGPNKMPVDLDEEDPDEDKGIRAMVEKNSDVVYGRQIPIHMQNPINLEESDIGREEILRAANQEK